MFDIDGDNRISSRDLGIYTAFISFSENFVKGNNNRLDESYSIFGTNGSACANFASYIMLQLGMDLTSVKSRTTHWLRTQAKTEGYYNDTNSVFNKIINEGIAIDEIIKPGDLFTRTDSNGGSSHTTIVENAEYKEATQTEPPTIVLNIIGYESNTTNSGVERKTYTIKYLGENEIELNNKKYNLNNENGWQIGFADYIRNN